MSAAFQLLDRLQRVKQVAPGRWIASCPCHNTKGQALSVRELEDGRVLVYDFGGCATDDVLAAVGLSVSDLFPERLGHHLKSERPNHWHARSEALKSLEHDVLFLALLTDAIVTGRAISQSDRDRAFESRDKFQRAVRMCA